VRLLILLPAIALAVAACGGEIAASTTSSVTTDPTTSTSSRPVSTTTSSTSSTTSSTTEAPPESSTTTEPVPVDPQYLMSLDGFVEYGALGDDAATVVEALVESHGDPTADSDWLEAGEHGCLFEGPMRTVTWIDPGLRLTFVDGESDHGDGPHLAHYSTVLPVDPPWEMEGVRREMTLEQVRAIFPEAEILADTPLRNIQFDPDVASFASIDAADQIREFWAGTDYCG
jgi:hypothetical protein